MSSKLLGGSLHRGQYKITFQSSFTWYHQVRHKVVKYILLTKPDISSTIGQKQVGSFRKIMNFSKKDKVVLLVCNLVMYYFITVHTQLCKQLNKSCT